METNSGVIFKTDLSVTLKRNYLFLLCNKKGNISLSGNSFLRENNLKVPNQAFNIS